MVLRGDSVVFTVGRKAGPGGDCKKKITAPPFEEAVSEHNPANPFNQARKESYGGGAGLSSGLF